MDMQGGAGTGTFFTKLDIITSTLTRVYNQGRTFIVSWFPGNPSRHLKGEELIEREVEIL